MKDKKLWSPWRMDYIKNPNERENIFKIKSESKNDKENLVLFRGKFSFILMNLYPYNNGHLMIAPYEICDDVTELDQDVLNEIMLLLKLSTKILKKTLNCQGINFGLNMGKASGAGIEEHLHFHIVPRWLGDTNFMPITGHTKIHMQSLYDTYDLLKQEFDLID